MGSADSSGRDHPSLVIAGVSLVLLLAIGGVSLLQRVTTTTPTGPNSTASVGGSCSTLVSPSSSLLTADVYQLTPGSTGLVCVDYGFQEAGSYSFSNVDYGPWLNGSTFAACGYGDGDVSARCSVVTITPSISGFNHSAGENVTVSYTIQANSDATGFFWFFLGPCYPIVLAFGAVPATVPGSISTCVSISNAPSSVNVTGVWNINVVSVSTFLQITTV